VNHAQSRNQGIGQEADPQITIDSAIETIVVDANKASIPQANRAVSVPSFVINMKIR
jgi:hypothetical protein